MSKCKLNSTFNPDFWNGKDDLDLYVNVTLIPTLGDYDYLYKAIAFKAKRDEPEERQIIPKTKRHGHRQFRRFRTISYDDRISFKRNERAKRIAIKKGGDDA